ncbi:MAG: glycosyl hydrolase [Acidobacteriia bacterium]|nr:glycosyl hydrolase [Terriglobia bacterium]
MTLRCIGPYRGGRVTAVAGVGHDPLTYYFGGTGGGVWKTTDAGANWEPVSDKELTTGSVGAIAVSESDPNVVYVGMGESPIRGNLSHGDGVWKSTDAGRSWVNAGLRDTRQIARVRVHPGNPDLVYVAAQGHAWGPNAERGIFRSRDGGKTWQKVLFVDDATGAADLSMDPNNPRILYAAFWQVVRHPWELVSGGPGSSLWKSTDGGDTWKKLSEGLPDELLGRIGVAASAARPGRVWAIVEAKKKGGLYVSDDFGEKWRLVNGDHRLRERAWYYSWVYPDPKNAETVYVISVLLHKSIDGGKTFGVVLDPHGDNHDLWIAPDDPQRMILGNDGGATVTFNGGRSWSTLNNQPTAQFYRVATDNRFPYWVYGSQQDNSSVGIPSGVPGSGIDFTDWHPVGGGESGWIAPDPTDPEVVYAGEYGGQITRYDHRTQETRQIMAWPQLADGRAGSLLKYRFQWNAPILISRHDPKTIYHAAQVLLRSRNEGETWEVISPDLTRNDPSKQGRSGGPISNDITGVELYDTIFALAESPHEKGVIWAGTDDGLIHITRDDGKTWQNVTPKGLPEWIQVNSIEPSPHDKATAYVAATRYKFDDFRPYLYKTNDYGRTWTTISAGIPDGAFTRVVREDPARRGLLFAGTEIGLYVSLDDGASWRPFQRNLPVVPITDLAVKNGDLVLATQGRSFWILDDLTPLRLWDDRLAASAVHLFPPRPTPRFMAETPMEIVMPKNVGTNMPGGVILDFWLKDVLKKGEVVTVEVLSGNKVIRTLSSEKKETGGAQGELTYEEALEGPAEKPLEIQEGLNRVVWDMRVLKPTLAPKTVFNEGDKAPPKVAPGTYRVRLKAAGQMLEQAFDVTPNPTSPATREDLKAQFELLEAIRDALSASHVTLMEVRDVRDQVTDLAARAKRLGKGDALEKRAATLSEKLTAIEVQLTNPEIRSDEDGLNYEPKLDHDFTYLAAIVANADRKPTAGSVQVFSELKGALDAIRGRFDALLAGDVAEFSRAAEEAKLPRVAPAPKIEP